MGHPVYVLYYMRVYSIDFILVLKYYVEYRKIRYRYVNNSIFRIKGGMLTITFECDFTTRAVGECYKSHEM